MEGLIFGLAYIWEEICVSKIDWATLLRGYLTESFLRYDFGWLICRGVFTWRGLFSEFYAMSQLI